MPVSRLFFLLLLSCLAYTACQVSPLKTQQDTGPRFDQEAYYLQLPNNYERLCALRSGLFAQYLVSRTDSSGPWMAQGDSVLMYIRQVGQPNRDGYWLLVQQFLSGLPNEPMVTWLEKVERISRDSFGTWPIAWPQKEFPSFLETSRPDFSLAEYEIELKGKVNTETRAAHYIFVRKDAAHFSAHSQLIPPVQENMKEKYSFRQSGVILQPGRTDLYAAYFNQDTVQQEKRRNYMIRKTAEEFATIRAHYMQQ